MVVVPSTRIAINFPSTYIEKLHCKYWEKYRFVQRLARSFDTDRDQVTSYFIIRRKPKTKLFAEIIEHRLLTALDDMLPKKGEYEIQFHAK